MHIALEGKKHKRKKKSQGKKKPQYKYEQPNPNISGGVISVEIDKLLMFHSVCSHFSVFIYHFRFGTHKKMIRERTSVKVYHVVNI